MAGDVKQGKRNMNVGLTTRQKIIKIQFFPFLNKRFLSVSKIQNIEMNVETNLNYANL